MALLPLAQSPPRLGRGEFAYPKCYATICRGRQDHFWGNLRPFSSSRRRSSQCRLQGFKIRAEGAIKEGDLVSSEDEFFKKVTKHQGPIIVDWMAKWCRKCIYLKPKLEKMLNEDFPGLDLVFIDVNAIPGTLVYGHGIKIHKDGEKVREHIAAEAAPKAIANIRSMVTDYLELNPEEKKLISSQINNVKKLMETKLDKAFVDMYV